MIGVDHKAGHVHLSTRHLERVPGDMLAHKRRVFDQAEEAAAEFQELKLNAELATEAAERRLREVAAEEEQRQQAAAAAPPPKPSD